MNLKERLQKFICSKGLTIADFERISHLSNGYVCKLNDSIGKRGLSDILTAFPDLNRVWLLTGEGEMLKEPLKQTPQTTTDKQGQRTLPLIPIEALAGRTTDDNSGINLQNCEQYTIPEFIDSGAQFLIRVSGDSMIPRYNNGDIVAVRKVEEITFFQWGKIYVLDTNQGALIKRVYEDVNNQENIICHSENSEVFADFSMPKKAIRGMFVITGVIRTE